MGKPENPWRFRGYPKWKKAMDGFIHGWLAQVEKEPGVMTAPTVTVGPIAGLVKPLAGPGRKEFIGG